MAPLAALACVLVLLGASHAIGPGAQHLVGLCSVAPMLTAVWYSVRATATVGALTTLLVSLFTQTHTWSDRTEDWLICVTTGCVALIAIAVALLRARQVAQLATLSHLASITVDAVLHPVPERIDTTDTAALYLAADQEARVGGDCFDVLDTPFGVRAFIADAKGKGLPAVRQAAHVVAAFREAAHHESDLAMVAARMDTSLVRMLGVGSEDFVTATLAEITADGVRVVNCGHPPPMAVCADGTVTELYATPTRPLGLGADPTPRDFELPAQCSVLLYTDGLSEARRGSLFLDVPLVLTTTIDPDLQRWVRAVASAATTFCPRGRDDIALLALRPDLRTA